MHISVAIFIGYISGCQHHFDKILVIRKMQAGKNFLKTIYLIDVDATILCTSSIFFNTHVYVIVEYNNLAKYIINRHFKVLLIFFWAAYKFLHLDIFFIFLELIKLEKNLKFDFRNLMSKEVNIERLLLHIML